MESCPPKKGNKMGHKVGKVMADQGRKEKIPDKEYIKSFANFHCNFTGHFLLAFARELNQQEVGVLFRPKNKNVQ